MVSCTDDTLWGFGQNVDLQLGFRCVVCACLGRTHARSQIANAASARVFVCFACDSDRADRMFPCELDRFRGIALKQVACGSRQTVVVTRTGAAWVWGWILHDTEQGVLNFSPVAPMKYLEGMATASINNNNNVNNNININAAASTNNNNNACVSAVSAGSTHLVFVLSDGSVQVVGENSENALCAGPVEVKQIRSCRFICVVGIFTLVNLHHCVVIRDVFR